MKKVTAVLAVLLCLAALNLAFAGTSQSSGSGSAQTTTQRPRFQR